MSYFTDGPLGSLNRKKYILCYLCFLYKLCFICLCFFFHWNFCCRWNIAAYFQANILLKFLNWVGSGPQGSKLHQVKWLPLRWIKIWFHNKHEPNFWVRSGPKIRSSLVNQVTSSWVGWFGNVYTSPQDCPSPPKDPPPIRVSPTQSRWDYCLSTDNRLKHKPKWTQFRLIWFGLVGFTNW